MMDRRAGTGTGTGGMQTHVLDDAAALPAVAVDDVAAKGAGVVEPAGVVAVEGPLDVDVLVGPDAREEVAGPLGAVLGHGVVVLFDCR